MGKRHYENLLEYFKYLITLTTLFLGIIVGVLLYVTYENGEDMKDDMERKAKELRADFEEKGRRMDAEMNRVRLDADQTVKNTKDAALIEIDQVKNVAKATATSEAQQQIELVFRNNNIDTFILNIAKKHIEPLAINAIEKQRIARVDSAISMVKSGNETQVYDGIAILQLNLTFRLQKRQQIEILKFISENPKNIATNSLIVVLGFENSEEVADFFKSLVLKESEENLIRTAVGYFFRQNLDPDYKFLSKAIKLKQNKRLIFPIIIDYNLIGDKRRVFTVLNSHELVDNLYDGISSSDLEYLTQDAKNRVIQHFSENQFTETYFYQKNLNN